MTHETETRVMTSVLLTIVIVLVVLAGQTRAEPAVTLSAEQTAAIEADVRARLEHPDSAKFSGIAAKSVGPVGPILLVCGYVNAKNSSGGYIGDLAFDGFLFNKEGWSFTAFKIDDPSHISAQQACHDLGLL
jgi:hypothetical protein